MWGAPVSIFDQVQPDHAGIVEMPFTLAIIYQIRMMP
jgi:hypothetical protein